MLGGTVVVQTSSLIASLAPRLRGVALILFALFVAHDAVYVARFGLGPDLATAMAKRGHDPYWVPASITVAFIAGVVFIAAIIRLARLERRSRYLPDPMPLERRAYLRACLRTWAWLLPTVAGLFVVQENLEHLVGHGHLLGLRGLAGTDLLHVVIPLAATTLALAACGTVVHWRVRVLVARVAAAAARQAHRIRSASVPKAWPTLASEVAAGWMSVRLDAGRAPPRSLEPTTS